MFDSEFPLFPKPSFMGDQKYPGLTWEPIWPTTATHEPLPGLSPRFQVSG